MDTSPPRKANPAGPASVDPFEERILRQRQTLHEMAEICSEVAGSLHDLIMGQMDAETPPGDTALTDAGMAFSDVGDEVIRDITLGMRLDDRLARYREIRDRIAAHAAAEKAAVRERAAMRAFRRAAGLAPLN